MTGRLAGKTALISGGARGQGAAEARLFASEGAFVMISDVLDDEGKATAAEIGDQCVYLHHDVTSPADWAHAVSVLKDERGRVDVLINNAGIFRPGPLLTTTYDEYQAIIRVNQDGVFHGMQAVAPTMVAQGSGSIINISSIAGLQGAPGFLAYSTSKWAVRGMTKCVAKELAPHGVRVNSIHPGIIDTQMLSVFDEMGVRAMARSRIPLGREASADEVARLALYLASDDSAYSTGSEFVVDGGYTA